MAQNQARRLAPGILDTNRRALAALRALPDYQPARRPRAPTRGGRSQAHGSPPLREEGWTG